VLLAQEHRLRTGAFRYLPPVPEWSDFDDCHAKKPYYVRVNMIEPNNGRALSTTQDARRRYTGERLLRERPKIYRQVVRLLGEGWSANKICKAVEISERKKSIIGILGNVAELGASRMEETIGSATLPMPRLGPASQWIRCLR